MIGNLLKPGGVNDTLAVVAVGDVAEPIVGAEGTPLVDPDDELRIGICLFYLTSLHLIFDLART